MEPKKEFIKCEFGATEAWLIKIYITLHIFQCAPKTLMGYSLYNFLMFQSLEVTFMC